MNTADWIIQLENRLAAISKISDELAEIGPIPPPTTLPDYSTLIGLRERCGIRGVCDPDSICKSVDATLRTCLSGAAFALGEVLAEAERHIVDEGRRLGMVIVSSDPSINPFLWGRHDPDMGPALTITVEHLKDYPALLDLPDDQYYRAGPHRVIVLGPPAVLPRMGTIGHIYTPRRFYFVDDALSLTATWRAAQKEREIEEERLSKIREADRKRREDITAARLSDFNVRAGARN